MAMKKMCLEAIKMIIGRKEEIELLRKSYGSGQAELVAIYGRRRVGKTYLVDNVFEGKMVFRHAGISPIELSKMSGRSSMKWQLLLQHSHPANTTPCLTLSSYQYRMSVEFTLRYGEPSIVLKPV